MNPFSRSIAPLFTAVLLLVTFDTSRALADDSDVFRLTLQSVTWIVSTGEESTTNSSSEVQTSYGTGVVVDAGQGLVLTAYHVVEERAKAVVFFPQHVQGELQTDPKYYAENAKQCGALGFVIAKDSKHDLALIRLATTRSNVSAIPLAPKSTEPGQSVFAIGNSGCTEGVLWRFVDGKVRQVYHKRMSYGGPQIVEAKFVETTMPINHGDSGGPVFNSHGELVGITACFTKKDNAIYYGIDISEVRALISPYLNTCKPELPIVAFAPPTATPAPAAPAPMDANSFEPPNAKAQPKLPPSPSAWITNPVYEHIFEMNGENGILMKCKLHVQHAGRKEIEVDLSFFHKNGVPLRIMDHSARDYRKILRQSTAMVPGSDRELEIDVALFMPYKLMETAFFNSNAEATTPRDEIVSRIGIPLVCAINVWDQTNQKWILPHSVCTDIEFYRFFGLPMTRVAK